MIKKKTRQIKVISILNTLISLDEFAYPGVILLSHILGEVESNVLFIVNTTNFVLFYQFMTPLWNPILKIKKKILHIKLSNWKYLHFEPSMMSQGKTPLERPPRWVNKGLRGLSR
jgi:hypothetical protein